MTALVAIALYALLFISGTALSKTIPKSAITPTTTTESSVLSATISVSTPSITRTPKSPTPTVQVTKMYKVKKVIDGDTIQVDIAGKTETVRLIGIDAQ